MPMKWVYRQLVLSYKETKWSTKDRHVDKRVRTKLQDSNSPIVSGMSFMPILTPISLQTMKSAVCSKTDQDRQP